MLFIVTRLKLKTFTVTIKTEYGCKKEYLRDQLFPLQQLKKERHWLIFFNCNWSCNIFIVYYDKSQWILNLPAVGNSLHRVLMPTLSGVSSVDRYSRNVKSFLGSCMEPPSVEILKRELNIQSSHLSARMIQELLCMDVGPTKAKVQNYIYGRAFPLR